MKVWNFGIIGAGLIADFHAKAIQSIDNARLISICGTNKEKVKYLSGKYNCKGYDTYNELLNSDEIDIVTIATPSGAHMEPAIEAANKGIHVLCEKPLDITLERIDRMIEAHKSANTRLGGIFNFRFNDAVNYLKNVIDSGRFGRLTYASVQVPRWRNDDYYKDSWHGTMKLDGGGALINQAIHMVDILQYLMGPIDSLQAFTATLGHPIEVEDTGLAIIKFNSGALGMIYGSTASYPGQHRSIEVTGTRGTVIQVENSFKVWQFVDQTDSDNDIINKFEKMEGGGGISNPAAISFETHARNISAFIDAVESGKPFVLDARESRKAVEIILAIYSSAREMKPYYF